MPRKETRSEICRTYSNRFQIRGDENWASKENR